MRKLLPVLVLLATCGPKKPPPIVVDDPADLDEETLNALVTELAPLVAEAAGKPFAVVPHARLGRASDLEAILEDEFLIGMTDLFKAPDWVLKQMAAQARAGAPSIVGKYGIQTKVLYLSPEAVTEVTAAVGLPPTSIGDVARLVLAHEMVHALQADLLTWTGFADMDQFDALRAVTEGQANFVEQRVSERLGLEPARHALDSAQGWDDNGPTGPGSFEIWALYGQGKAFVAWHEARGGSEASWDLIRHPPPSTSMIFRPETYTPELKVTEDFAPVLDGVEQILTEGTWVAIVGRTGELELRQELFGSDPAEVTTALDALVAGTERQAMRSDRQAVVRVMRFTDAEAAQRMVRLETAAKDRGPMPEGAPVWLDTTTPFEGVVADLALQRVSGPENMGVSYEVTDVWIARGDLVIAVRVQAFRPGVRMQRAVQTVLDRLDAR